MLTSSLPEIVASCSDEDSLPESTLQGRLKPIERFGKSFFRHPNYEWGTKEEIALQT